MKIVYSAQKYKTTYFSMFRAEIKKWCLIFEVVFLLDRYRLLEGFQFSCTELESQVKISHPVKSVEHLTWLIRL